MRPARLVLLALAAPLLVAATDPADDATACRSGEPVPTTVDLAGADGFLTEEGQAVEFRVRFHGEVTSPDPQEPAFRVDIVLHDPRQQAFSVGPYREVNRIIRYDATDPPEVGVLLLSEAGISSPATYFFEDGELRITLAARQLGIEAENLEHVDLRPIRWSVLVRDGNACDTLTDAPTLRLSEEAPTAPGGGGSLGLSVGIAFVILLGAAALAVVVATSGRRRARSAGPAPAPDHSSGRNERESR